jgi:HK97 family phage prohead protease
VSERSKRIQRDRFERFMSIEPDAITEERTVTASLSSEQPVERWFGNEVLVHNKAAIDASRAESGLPLLLNHDHGAPIGLVKDLRLEDGRLRGTLHFHQHTETARSAWDMVREGWLKGVSIGYQIKRWVEDAKSDLVRVTDWTLLEASVVSVPADATVGINRSMENDTMAIDGNDTVTETGGGSVVDLVRVHEKGKQVGQQEGAKLERQRIASINDAFARRSVPRTSQFEALKDEAVAGGWSVERANAAILDLMAQDSEPAVDHRSISDTATAPKSREMPRAEMRRDSYDSVKEGVELAILVRSQLATPEQRKKLADYGYGGFTLAELGREVLEGSGIRVRVTDKRALAGMVLGRAGHGSSDFTDILANIATKAVMRGWEEAPETWNIWTRIIGLPDFKQAKIVGLSNFSDLAEVPEQAEYTHGTMSDISEAIQLKTYGRLFTISRQAIINDDTSSFTAIPRAMARAASRMIGDLAYDVLKNGTSATLDQDSTALFDASTHKNYVTSGAAPSVTTLNAGFTAMAVQTDPSGGSFLNIAPRYLIVPRAIENTATTLVAATYDPAGTAGTLTPNPFQGRLTVVADARLDDTTWTTHAGKGWFLAADQNVWDTVVVATLNGETAPYLEEQQGFSADGVTYKVRIDAAAEPLDFRTLYFNDGQ